MTGALPTIAPDDDNGPTDDTDPTDNSDPNTNPDTDVDPDEPPEDEDAKIIDETFDIYATDNSLANVEFVSLDFSVEGPLADIDPEKRTGKLSVGSVNFDVTAARATGDLDLGPLADVDLTGNFKTVNFNGTLGADGTLDGRKSKGSIQIAGGAEAMAFDGKVSIDVTITPKSVADTFGGIYNTVIDPAVDFFAGQDVPGVPEAPDSWNKGLAISGYLEGGFGASAKGHFGLEVGKGTKNRVAGGGKFGAGPVGGAGGSIGLVWE